MIHLARDGTQLGQFSLEQVNAMLAAGQLQLSDLAWTAGLDGWVPLAGLQGVVPPRALSAAPPVEPAHEAPASVYAPPRGNLAATVPHASAVSPGAVLALRQTRPWVLFLAILGIVFTGLMLLGGIAVAAFGAYGAAASSSRPGGPEAGVLAGMGVVYLLLAMLYLYPIIKLFKYAGAISRLARSSAAPDLEDALRHQKSFWKFVGILTLVIMVIYLIVIVAVGAGALNAFSAMSHSTPTPPPSSPPGYPAGPAAP